MNNIDQILEDNYRQLDILKNELLKLKEIKNRIEVSIGSNNELPIIFKERFDKIVEFTNEYTTVLGNAVNVFLEGNNDLLTKNSLEFSSKISNLSSEINRLIEFDLETSFKELEKQFLANSKEEINKELEKFDNKSNNIQSKIDAFGKEITRLSTIELEAHFDKHQSKLSEVFISVNGINSLMSTISQNFNNIIKNIGELEQTLVKNQKELINGLTSIVDNFKDNQKEVFIKLTETETKLNSILTQNEILKKDLDFNKKMNFFIVAVVLFTLIIVLIK